MEILLLCIITVLAALNYIQYGKGKLRSQHLSYIHGKFHHIIDKGTFEKLPLFTDDPEIQTLLSDLNYFLDNNNKIKAEFISKELSIKKMLANMSHDLKTPLTVVLGVTEILTKDKGLSAEEKDRLLRKVYEKSEEILNLMNKFFDLAKLESGDTQISLSKININVICKNNILFFYESITSKGLEVAIDIPETVLYAFSNEDALNRILNNLISNALRYGSEGKIVGITLRYDNEYLYVDIWDSGKGIRELHQNLIFERLFTLDDSRNQLYQGSGLGLTITKRLVEKIDGEISLVSKPYEKTTFTVKLKRIQY